MFQTKVSKQRLGDVRRSKCKMLTRGDVEMLFFMATPSEDQEEPRFRPRNCLLFWGVWLAETADLISQVLGVQGKYMGVSKNSGNYPKMDGLFHGKPYYLMG